MLIKGGETGVSTEYTGKIGERESVGVMKRDAYILNSAEPEHQAAGSGATGGTGALESDESEGLDTGRSETSELEDDGSRREEAGAESTAEEERSEEERPPSSQQPTYVEKLERRLVEAQDQLREYIQAFKKLKEDNAEFRERLQREAEKDLARLRGKVVSELFEVADNLDRSITGAESHWDADAFLAGIKMVQSQFLEKLQGLGLEVIEPVGKKFDPNEAEAVALVPTSDPDKDDTVVDVYARGYRMNGKVIRPAKVSVAKLAEDG